MTRHHPKSIWTEDRIALLKKLHAEGLSFESMTFQPGFKGLGFSRNAMIGKATRLGLAQRSTAVRVSNHKSRSPKTDPVWNAERDRLLRTLWVDPEHTGAQIAVRINAATQPRIPLTKMSIISRAARLDLGPKPVADTWSEDAVDLLRSLWADAKLSTAEIARKVSRTWHSTSKKAADLGLPRRKAEAAPAEPDGSDASVMASAERRRAAMAAIPTNPTRFDLLAAGRCKFPIGDPPAGEGMDHMVCCGSARVADKPYCAGHEGISHSALKAHQPKDGKALERQLRRFA